MSLIKVTIASLVLGLTSKMDSIDERTMYRAKIDANGIFCAVDINRIPVTWGNIKRDEQKVMDSNFKVARYLKKGVNEVGIIIWEPEEGRDESIVSSCQVEIKAIVEDSRGNQIDSRSIGKLYVIRDEFGKYSVKGESYNMKDSQLDSFSVERLPLVPQNRGKYEDVRISHSINIDHLYSFSWHDAEIFVDTAENREKLWQKYEELYDIIERKDIEAFYGEFHKIGIEDRAKYEGIPAEFMEWLGLPRHTLETMFASEDFKLLPFNRDDYGLKIMANGRIVTFISKDGTAKTPVTAEFTYENPSCQSGYMFSGRFSLINGEIQSVLW